MKLDPSVVADFSQETIWISILKGVAILVFLLVSVLFALWFERRLIGRMQYRIGPNWHGPQGLLQSLGDAIKLLLKEDMNVTRADKFLYLVAPLISALCSFLVYAVIPFGPNVTVFGVSTPLQMTDFSMSVLYILAVAAVGVYGIVLAGWASGSTFPLLGGVRSSAQVISYELAMGLSLVTVFIMSRSMSTSTIVASQSHLGWYAFILAPAFVLYVISMFGEVNRLPFDLPESEGELVSGYHTEYSSMKFAWFFLAEYINMLNVSAVATTLFLGGWLAPWPLDQIGAGMLNTGWWPVLWFLAKVWFCMFLFVWVRGTLLRFRYDQFMKLGWKLLIPAGLVWVTVIIVKQAVDQFTKINTQPILFGAAGLILVVVLVVAALPAKKQKVPKAEAAPFDAFASGHPVPPLPGQTLPPSPRQRAVTTISHSEVTKEVSDE